MKGNVPAGAKRITNFGDLMGGWKAYMFGAGQEWLFNATIDAGQNGAQAVFDWFYVHSDSTGEGHEDTAPNSTFTGSWENASLDAVGSGRLTLVAFWQQDGHQYATGSFIWPDGGQCTIALVRP